MFKLLVTATSLALHGVVSGSLVQAAGSAVDGSEPDRCTTIAVGKLVYMLFPDIDTLLVGSLSHFGPH